MPVHIKSALVVLTVTLMALWLLRPVFTRLMLADTYRRRAIAWFVVVAAAFAAPNFWLYIAAAALITLWLARRDPNPAALFLLLLPLVPPVRQPVWGLGIINSLFDMTHPRLLALVLLLPLALRLAGRDGRPRVGKVGVDWLVLAFMALQVILYWPYYNFTSSMRQLFLLVIDLWLPYYVMRRAFANTAQVRDALACFVLSMACMVGVALAEVVLATNFFSVLAEQWKVQGLFFAYLLRDGVLRAQGASGQPIVFGYQFAMALALWLYLQSHIPQRSVRWLGVGALTLGLILALSRGPWLGGVVIALVYAGARPGAGARLSKLAFAAVAVIGIALVSPWSDKVISLMPFVGDVDSASVTYRQRIIEVSMGLIADQPFFGNPLARTQLEELRQGQGIIDIVNVYIAFALAYGGVGVALWAGCFLVTIYKLARMVRSRAVPPDAAHMVAALLSALVAVMVVLSTTSNYLTVPLIYWSLIGCGLSLVRLAPITRAAPAGLRPASAGAVPAARPASRASTWG